jgi:hypothetical protein
VGKAVLLVVFCALASGCVSDQERAVQAQNIAEADAEACSFYGFKPGTPEFSQCRMARDLNRQATALAPTSDYSSRSQPLPQHY